MLFSAEVRYILNFRFFIGRPSFMLPLYLTQSLKHKCASSFTLIVTAAIRDNKINWIRFGQILTNQDISFKRKSLAETILKSKKMRGKMPSKTPRFWLAVAPFLIIKKAVKTVQIRTKSEKQCQRSGNRKSPENRMVPGFLSNFELVCRACYLLLN